MSRPSAAILEHLIRPRNAGAMVAADAVGRADLDGRAPRMVFYLKIAEGRVAAATFETFGCGYAIACCSVLTELVVGRTLEGCAALEGNDIADALGGLPAEKRFCSELAIAALADALREWRGSAEHRQSA